MPGLDECVVVLERDEMVSVGSEADVSVGAHCENSGVLDAEEISGGGIEVSDIGGEVGARAEGDDRFEQGRIGGEFPYGDKEVRERRPSCGWTAEEYEGVADAVGELVKSAGLRARRSDRNRIG